MLPSEEGGENESLLRLVAADTPVFAHLSAS